MSTAAWSAAYEVAWSFIQKGLRGMSRHHHKYGRVPSVEDDSVETTTSVPKRPPHSTSKVLIVVLITAFLVAATALGVIVFSHATKRSAPCDSADLGFTCQPEVSHSWGQYSPYFSVPSQVSIDVPEGCHITFAQGLSRHGARDPTASKTAAYDQIIQQIQLNVKVYRGKYTFLKDFQYTLGADQLTVFGEQEMVNSGTKFYDRYKDLTSHSTPIIRASGQTRVVESAQNFSQGYHQALIADKNAVSSDPYPYPITIISESPGSNNTLSHGLCDAFESGPISTIGSSAQDEWATIFLPPITARLNQQLPSANLTTEQTVYMMDLCPFTTVASSTGTLSPFCHLFSRSEWLSYNHYQSIGKYYSFGSGNPLGPTQGVSFAKELIARMTNTPIHSTSASINFTIDSSNTTFPLGRSLYADFSHDNDMTSIFFALGLYNATSPLSKTSLQTADEADGYSAAWTVPFAARAYFEKMSCADRKEKEEEWVRAIVNDRVVPLQNCGADELGRCTLSKWVDSLSFAREGGRWDQCFA